MARSRRVKKDVRDRAMTKSKARVKAKRLRAIVKDYLLQFALSSVPIRA